eukprot:6479424-Amphidinium_carterae.2
MFSRSFGAGWVWEKSHIVGVAAVLDAEGYYEGCWQTYLKELPFAEENLPKIERAVMMLGKAKSMTSDIVESIMEVFQSLPTWEASIRACEVKKLKQALASCLTSFNLEAAKGETNLDTEKTLMKLLSEAVIVLPDHPEVHDLQIAVAERLTSVSKQACVQKLFKGLNEMVAFKEKHPDMATVTMVALFDVVQTFMTGIADEDALPVPLRLGLQLTLQHTRSYLLDVVATGWNQADPGTEEQQQAVVKFMQWAGQALAEDETIFTTCVTQAFHIQKHYKSVQQTGKTSNMVLLRKAALTLQEAIAKLDAEVKGSWEAVVKAALDSVADKAGKEGASHLTDVQKQMKAVTHLMAKGDEWHKNLDDCTWEETAAHAKKTILSVKPQKLDEALRLLEEANLMK